MERERERERERRRGQRREGEKEEGREREREREREIDRDRERGREVRREREKERERQRQREGGGGRERENHPMRHSFLTALPSLKDNSTEMSSYFMRMSMMEAKLDTIVKALQSDVSTKESEQRIVHHDIQNSMEVILACHY